MSCFHKNYGKITKDRPIFNLQSRKIPHQAVRFPSAARPKHRHFDCFHDRFLFLFNNKNTIIWIIAQNQDLVNVHFDRISKACLNFFLHGSANTVEALRFRSVTAKKRRFMRNFFDPDFRLLLSFPVFSPAIPGARAIVYKTFPSAKEKPLDRIQIFYYNKRTAMQKPVKHCRKGYTERKPYRLQTPIGGRKR